MFANTYTSSLVLSAGLQAPTEIALLLSHFPNPPLLLCLRLLYSPFSLLSPLLFLLCLLNPLCPPSSSSFPSSPSPSPSSSPTSSVIVVHLKHQTGLLEEMAERFPVFVAGSPAWQEQEQAMTLSMQAQP